MGLKAKCAAAHRIIVSSTFSPNIRSKAILANRPASPGYRKPAKSMETSEASPSSVIYVGAVSLLAVAKEVLPCVT